MTKYKTKDLRLAAYLWSQLTYQVGYTGLVPVVPNPGVFWFSFELDCSPEQLDEMLNDYSNDRTCVEPNSYNTKIRRLLESLSEVRSK
jgi:hypothetical protein